MHRATCLGSRVLTSSEIHPLFTLNYRYVTLKIASSLIETLGEEILVRYPVNLTDLWILLEDLDQLSGRASCEALLIVK